MAVSEAALKANYRRYSDEKLLRIVSENAAKLRPEALVLLREEMATRGLAAIAERAIEVQLRVATDAETLEYCGLLQAQPCPRCCSTCQPLNAAITSKVLSMLVLTFWERRFVIVCPTCLSKLIREASNITVLLGWWGLPWGVIRTIRALNSNRKTLETSQAPYPSELLKAFVRRNLSRIEAVKDDENALQRLLATATLA
jgi:hypothetical protein